MNPFLRVLTPLLLMLVPPALVLLGTHWKRRPQALVTCMRVLLILQAIAVVLLSLHVVFRDNHDVRRTIWFCALSLVVLVFDSWVVFVGRRASAQSVTAFSIVVMTATVTLMTTAMISMVWGDDACDRWCFVLSCLSTVSVITAPLLATWMNKRPVWMPWLAYAAVATHMFFLFIPISLMSLKQYRTWKQDETCRRVAQLSIIVSLALIMGCYLLVVSRPLLLFQLHSSHLTIRVMVSILTVVLPIAITVLFGWWQRVVS
ncbi:hypothetical protein EBZ80_14220 [bacterium]|nr:hypothetical protein [bacterium]